MVERSSGVILHTSSVQWRRPSASSPAYGAAKAALTNYSKELATEFGPHGIRVNTVSPNKVGSPVGTDVEPENRPRKNLIGRGCTPEDIANAVTFMVSDQAGFITGTDLLVDGGALITSGD